MDPERRMQIRTGVFTLVVLIAAAIVVGSLNREGGLFTARYTLFADFDNIEGLFVNSPVWLAGNLVGRVRDIEFLPPGAEKALRVELDINARVRDRIGSDSIASVHQAGILGDMYVAISLRGPGSEPIEDGGMVESRDPLSLNVLADEGAELLQNLVVFSASAERIVGAFEEAMGTESVASTLGSLSNIVSEVETGDGVLHALIYGDGAQAVADLQASLADLRSSLRRVDMIVAEIEDGHGMAHDFIYGAEDSDMSTLAAVRSAAERLESVLRKIDEGEGSLGALLNDPTVDEDIKLLVGGARESALLRGLIDYVRTDREEPE